MTIDDFNPKIKSFFDKPAIFRVLYSLSICLLMVASFGLGKLSVLDQKNDKNESSVAIYLPNGTRYVPNREEGSLNGPNLANLETLGVNPGNTGLGQDLKVFASKNGKNYYYLDCTAGNTIKEENKVWFADPEKAEEAGYTKSSKCK